MVRFHALHDARRHTIPQCPFSSDNRPAAFLIPPARIRTTPAPPCGDYNGARDQADPEGVHAAVSEGGSRFHHQEVGYADKYVPGPPHCTYGLQEAGLLRAVRTVAACPQGATHCTCAVRVPTPGVPYLAPRRSIGSSELKQSDTDPYLMLDELPPTNYAPGEFPGAPWHPHRGMDTVMYNKQGTMGHEDSMGGAACWKCCLGGATTPAPRLRVRTASGLDCCML